MSQRIKVTGTRSCVLWLLALVAIILIVGVVVSGLILYPQLQEKREAQARLDETDKHYQAGVSFQNVGDWEAAEGEFKQVITLDANYKDVLTRLAEVRARLAETAATATVVAIAQVEQTQAEVQATATAQAQATTEALEVHYQKGLGYMNMGRWEEAKAELEQVFEVDPSYKEVQARLVEAEAKLKELHIPTLTLTPIPMLTDTPRPTRPPSPTPTPQPSRTPTSTPIATAMIVETDARMGWQSTGVSVEQGAKLTIEVIDGQWTRWKGNESYNMGEGGEYICANWISYSQCAEPLPDFPAGGLIGQIGGQTFSVGRGSTIIAQRSGTLLLRINDDDGGLYDNDGSLTVRVAVER